MYSPCLNGLGGWAFSRLFFVGGEETLRIMQGGIQGTRGVC